MGKNYARMGNVRVGIVIKYIVKTIVICYCLSKNSKHKVLIVPLGSTDHKPLVD